jgi:putative heme-binding domain-containing protein
MIWFGVEPLVPADPPRAVALARQSRMPHVSRLIARRLADADELEPLARGIRDDERDNLELLLGMLDGLEGRFNVPPPPSWAPVYAKLQTGNRQRREIAVEIAQRFGDAAAAQQMLRTLMLDSAPLEQRRRALQNLSNRRQPELEPKLPQLLETDGLRRDVIRAMAAYDSEVHAQTLMERYDQFSEDDRLEVVQTLASRPKSGWRLTQAIKSGAVPRRDVPAYIARQLRRVVGNGFVEVWGPIDGVSQDNEQVFARYQDLLTDEALASADPSRGRDVFKRTCGACHTMFGDGGKIGPDITGANRGNLNYLLDNVLTPSAVIQDAYKMQIVLTDDGRTFSGILAGETDRQLQLRVANQPEPVLIPKSQIEAREIAAVSMMPNGLLTNLPDAEVLDLVAYLRSPRQVPLPSQ